MRNVLFGLLFFVTVANSAFSQIINVSTPITKTTVKVEVGKAYDGIKEVNEHRRLRGLKPFIYDEKLAISAANCSAHRAKNRISGHSNDFSFCPPGTNASAAGCGCWTPGTGWGTCCSSENYTYAGAAWTIGSDGKCYMHLFVR